MYILFPLLVAIILAVVAYLVPKFQAGLYCFALGLAVVWLLMQLGVKVAAS